MHRMVPINMIFLEVLLPLVCRVHIVLIFAHAHHILGLPQVVSFTTHGPI